MQLMIIIKSVGIRLRFTKVGFLMRVSKRVMTLSLILIVFICIFVAVVSAVIYSTPAEIVSNTAGNYTVNLANGGYSVEDGGYLFFSKPGEKGIYRSETQNVGKTVKISDSGDGFLQNIKNSYYYVDDNRLCVCDWDGNRETVLIDYAKKPMVVGSLIFYLNENNELCKYSLQNEEVKIIVGDKPVEEFLIYSRKIYYIADNSDIRKIGFNGNDDELFVKTENKVSKMSLDGKNIFYIDGEKLYSAMLLDNKIVKTEIINTEEYAIFGNYIIYKNKNKVYHCDINKLVSKDSKASPKEIYTGEAKGFSIDENYFYYFDSDNNLFRIDHEGNKTVRISQEGE